MKTEMKIRGRMKLSTIVLCVAAISLGLVPCRVEAANYTVLGGETLDLPGLDRDNNYVDTLDFLTIQSGGTANLNPGVTVGIVDAWEDSIVNIYGGTILGWVQVWDPSLDEVKVSVYGTDFFVGTIEVPNDSLPIPFTIPTYGVTLTVYSGSDDSFSILFFGVDGAQVNLAKPSLEVAIDIKPGGTPNAINRNSKGVVPVAILGNGVLDLETIDLGTVDFAGASPVKSAIEDVNGDGFMDMVLHFKTNELTDLTDDSTEATLTCDTTDGISIQATDSVKIVPSKK